MLAMFTQFKTWIIIGFLALASVAAPALAQLQAESTPHTGAYVVKAYAEPDRTGKMLPNGPTIPAHTTGKLHLVYSDGTEIVKNLRAHGGKHPSINRDLGPQAGFSSITISDDRHTVIWSEDYYVTASYTYSVFLDIFRNGQVVFRDSDNYFLSSSEFINGGKQLVASWVPDHGPPCRSVYKLYNLGPEKTSEVGLFADVYRDSKRTEAGVITCVRKDVPSWAWKMIAAQDAQ